MSAARCPGCGTSPAYRRVLADPWDTHTVCPGCGHSYSHPASNPGGPRVRWYRGVIIDPPNYCHMYSARVTVPGGGVRLAADTLAGIKSLITAELSAHGKTREEL